MVRLFNSIYITLLLLLFLNFETNGKNIESICESPSASYIEHYQNFIGLSDFCSLIGKEPLSHSLKRVHIEKNIFSRQQSKWIIHMAEKYAKKHQWSTDRHEQYPTTDNNIDNIPSIRDFIFDTVYGRLLPLYPMVYLELQPPFNLEIDEVFIAKYVAQSGKQRSLDYHVDLDDFSFVIPLNDDFTGGGTSFIHTGVNITKDKIGIGDALLFCGRNRHAGLEVLAGTRYILAGFLSVYAVQYCHSLDTVEFY